MWHIPQRRQRKKKEPDALSEREHTLPWAAVAALLPLVFIISTGQAKQLGTVLCLVDNFLIPWWRVISALLKGYDSLLQGKGRKQLNKWGIWLVKEIVETYLSWPESKNKLFSDCKTIKAAKAVLIRKYPENPGNPGAVFIAKCPHSWPLSFGGPEKRMGLLLGYSSPANTGVTEVWHNLHADSEQQLRSTQNSAEQW